MSKARPKGLLGIPELQKRSAKIFQLAEGIISAQDPLPYCEIDV